MIPDIFMVLASKLSVKGMKALHIAVPKIRPVTALLINVDTQKKLEEDHVLQLDNVSNSFRSSSLLNKRGTPEGVIFLFHYPHLHLFGRRLPRVGYGLQRERSSGPLQKKAVLLKIAYFARMAAKGT